MPIDTSQSNGGIVIGIRARYFCDPGAIRQVDSEQRVIERIAGAPIGDMPPVSIGGGEVSPKNDLARLVRGGEFIEQRVDLTLLGDEPLKRSELIDRTRDAALRGYFRCACG